MDVNHIASFVALNYFGSMLDKNACPQIPNRNIAIFFLMLNLISSNVAKERKVFSFITMCQSSFCIKTIMKKVERKVLTCSKLLYYERDLPE